MQRSPCAGSGIYPVTKPTKSILHINTDMKILCLFHCFWEKIPAASAQRRKYPGSSVKQGIFHLFTAVAQVLVSGVFILNKRNYNFVTERQKNLYVEMSNYKMLLFLQVLVIHDV